MMGRLAICLKSTKFEQGSLNYLFWGKSNKQQIYGTFEGFPLRMMHEVGLVSYTVMTPVQSRLAS